MRYVMVTHRSRHWDHLGDEETYYPKDLMQEGMAPSHVREGTETLYIKLDPDMA
ncbi:MAG: hypothetical protein JXD19_12590 [Deltaproteobacteria bacterium]|nr:hypothetical protein [Deltaproteobacteria bacterium]